MVFIVFSRELTHKYPRVIGHYKGTLVGVHSTNSPETRKLRAQRLLCDVVLVTKSQGQHFAHQANDGWRAGEP